MRVLVLTPGFAASEQDYNCIPPLQLYARAMQQRGFELEVLCFEYPFRSETQSWHGIPVASANGQNRRWLRWRSWSRVSRYAEEINRSKKLDLIHSFWLGPAWVIGQKLARKWNIPHWTTLMGQDARSSNRYLRRLRPEDAARLITLSPFHAAVLEKSSGLQAAQQIPWGIDAAEACHPLPAERPLDILGAGSLISLKNWDKWLETIVLLKKTHPNLKAELIGEGPLLGQLTKKVQHLGLTDQVRLRGSLPRPDLLRRMAASKVLLHTSDYESFGFVLPEAAMNGCRLVATPVGIAPQLADCASEPEHLARLLANALRQDAPATPSMPYTIEKAADAYQRLFSTV